ncbi:DUF3221 domain-containing protein [Priestia megaterium]|nr:DUF3221 domain-containing protein [Priestia megaterium]
MFSYIEVMKMMKLLFMSIFLLQISFGLTSCESKSSKEILPENKISDKKVVEGRVKELKDGNYLVISNTDINIKEISNLSTQQLIDKYSEVYIFSTNKEEYQRLLQSGLKVRIWYDYIRESNPPRSKILKFEIIK